MSALFLNTGDAAGVSDMYAVIKTGGKQYRVSQGDTLRVEKLNAGEGESVEFAMVPDEDPGPRVEDRRVEGSGPPTGGLLRTPGPGLRHGSRLGCSGEDHKKQHNRCEPTI